MSTPESRTVATLCEGFERDRTRLLDILLAVQKLLGQIDEPAIDQIAAELGIPRVEVAGVVSFYSFLSKRPKGRVVIRLCNDIIEDEGQRGRGRRPQGRARHRVRSLDSPPGEDSGGTNTSPYCLPSKIA